MEYQNNLMPFSKYKWANEMYGSFAYFRLSNIIFIEIFKTKTYIYYMYIGTMCCRYVSIYLYLYKIHRYCDVVSNRSISFQYFSYLCILRFFEDSNSTLSIFTFQRKKSNNNNSDNGECHNFHSTRKFPNGIK